MNPSEYWASRFEARMPGSSCLTRLHFRSGIHFVSGFLPTRPRGACSCLQLVVAFRRPHSGLSPPSSSSCPTHFRSPFGLPTPCPPPQPCSVLIPGFEVTNSETAGFLVRFREFFHCQRGHIGSRIVSQN